MIPVQRHRFQAFNFPVMIEDRPPFRRTRRRASYEEVRRFRTDNEYRSWWRQEANNWKINSRHPHLHGTVEYWRCAYMRGRRYICQSRLKIIISVNGQSVVVNRSTDHPHSHDMQTAAADPSRVRTVIHMEPFPVQVASHINLSRPAADQQPFSSAINATTPASVSTAQNASTPAKNTTPTSVSTAQNASTPGLENSTTPASVSSSTAQNASKPGLENSTTPASVSTAQNVSTPAKNTTPTSVSTAQNVSTPAKNTTPTSVSTAQNASTPVKSTTPTSVSTAQDASKPGLAKSTPPAIASITFVPPGSISQAQSQSKQENNEAPSSTSDGANVTKPADGAPKSSTATSGNNPANNVPASSSTQNK